MTLKYVSIFSVFSSFEYLFWNITVIGPALKSTMLRLEKFHLQHREATQALHLRIDELTTERNHFRSLCQSLRQEIKHLEGEKMYRLIESLKEVNANLSTKLMVNMAILVEKGRKVEL